MPSPTSPSVWASDYCKNTGVLWHWTLVARDHSNAGSNAVAMFVKLKIVKCPPVL